MAGCCLGYGGTSVGFHCLGTSKRRKHSELPFGNRSVDLPDFLKIQTCYLVRCKTKEHSFFPVFLLPPWTISAVRISLQPCPVSITSSLPPYTQITMGLPSAPPEYKGTCCERARRVISLFSLLLCRCSTVLLKAEGWRCQFFYSFRMVQH